MKRSYAMKKMTRTLKHLPSALRQIHQLVSDPTLTQSYYPDLPRKSKLAIYADLIGWWLHHQEVNEFYFYYGLDRASGVKASDYLSYPEFRTIRDTRNRKAAGTRRYSYVCLLRDKFVFGQLAASLGMPTPENMALCTSTSIRWIKEHREIPLDKLTDDPLLSIEACCKSATGIGGEGVFFLKVNHGKLFINDQPATLDQLRNAFTSTYLLQQPIQQHPELSRLHPHSINTIRVITLNDNGKISVLWSALKVGTHGRRIDNAACGGVAALIDLATGRLRAPGVYSPGKGTVTDCHPDSKIRFEGFEVPFFKEAVQCVSELHRYLYGVHSIGWDIGITPTGPTIIEGNDDWGGCFPMAFEPGFRTRFLQAYGILPTENQVSTSSLTSHSGAYSS